MRQKIKLFAGQTKDKYQEKGLDINEEIRSGKVSEIVASFSAQSIGSSVKERSSSKVIIPSHFVNQNLQKTKNKIAIPVAFSKSADPIHEKKSKVANFLNEKKQSLQSLG